MARRGGVYRIDAPLGAVFRNRLQFLFPETVPHRRSCENARRFQTRRFGKAAKTQKRTLKGSSLLPNSGHSFILKPDVIGVEPPYPVTAISLSATSPGDAAALALSCLFNARPDRLGRGGACG